MIEFNIDEHLACDCDVKDVVGNLVEAALKSKVKPEYIMDTLRNKLEETITHHEAMAQRAKDIRLTLCRQGDPTNFYQFGGSDYLDFNSAAFSPDYKQSDDKSDRVNFDTWSPTSSYYGAALGSEFYKPLAGQDTISF